jgi:hypothetical protein
LAAYLGYYLDHHLADCLDCLSVADLDHHSVGCLATVLAAYLGYYLDHHSADCLDA